MFPPKRTKDDVAAALMDNMPDPVTPVEIVEPENINTKELAISIINDVEDDYEIARENVKKLLKTSDNVIAAMEGLAHDAEHPRAFEVLGQLMKQGADMNTQLLDLAKQRKTLVAPDEKGTSSVTAENAIFVGTTTDLQTMLKSKPAESPAEDEETFDV